MTFPFLLTVYWIFAFQPVEEKGNLHRFDRYIHSYKLQSINLFLM